MTSGEWRVANGKWRMASGKYKLQSTKYGESRALYRGPSTSLGDRALNFAWIMKAFTERSRGDE